MLSWRWGSFPFFQSKVTLLSIDRMRFGWRFWIDLLRFYFTATRLAFLLLAAEFLAIPGPRFWESWDSRFCAAKSRRDLDLRSARPVTGIQKPEPRNSSKETKKILPRGPIQNSLKKLQKLIEQRRIVLQSAPPHTGSPGPFGPGTPEESEKSPERVPRGRAPKVPKECAPESQKSPKRV